MGFWDVAGGIATGGILPAAKLALGATQSGFNATAPMLDDPDRKARFAKAIADAQNRTGPQDEYRQSQNQLVGQLQQTASGQGPSAAQATAKMQQDRAMAGQNAMAASARGVNPALAQRMAAQNTAQAQQGIAQQAGVQQIQEQQGAQALLGQTLSGARGQDIQVQQQIDQLTQQYEAMGLSADEANQRAQLEAQQLNAGIDMKNTQNASQFIGGILGAAGGGMAMKSDKRFKTDIKNADGKIYKFLDALDPKEYSYKDPSDGPGKHVGPMAQDLEKSEMGKSMVQDTPEGKMVSVDGQSYAKVLAAQASLHKRLKELEARKGGKK